jgi:hypothetical protein
MKKLRRRMNRDRERNGGVSRGREEEGGSVSFQTINHVQRHARVTCLTTEYVKRAELDSASDGEGRRLG